MRSLFSLLIWYALLYRLQAADLSKPLKPKGPLGIALDYSLATLWPTIYNPKGGQDPRAYAWSSHHTYGQDVSGITDGQMWQLALDAFEEMKVDLKEYGVGGKNQPKAMAVLAWGKQLIFASSQKGPSFSYEYLGTPVSENLHLCQVVWKDLSPNGSDKRHKNEAGCAEPTAVQLYYFTDTIDLAFYSGRIGTVVKAKDGSIQPTDPCGDPAQDTWGCNLFVQTQGLRVIDTNTPAEPYDLTTLVGGVGTIDQIQMCSVIRRFT